MLKRGQKCLEMAVTNSWPITNDLAGEHDRLYGPAAEQLRRQVILEEHLSAL